MKVLAVVLSFFISVSTFAGEKECRVVSTIDNNPFEEGLGPYGDPSVDSDSQTVTLPDTGKVESLGIGQMTWRTKDGDKITRKTSGTTTIYKVVPKEGDSSYTVKTYASERGVLLVSENGKSAVFGTFDCSSTALVEKASIGSPQVKPTKSVPKNVREAINKVDLAFEMGDGYYDLKATKLYAVYRSGSKEIVGYLLWAKFYYTEDNEDVEATTTFDRNGLWLGEFQK